MNSIIQGQLDRVDSALNKLVESIASYNPSVPAAHDLLIADKELTTGIDNLTTHQANHAKILILRSQISSLNASITSTLSILAESRTDILSQHITPLAGPSTQVSSNILLDYAARIGRYTRPKDQLHHKKVGTGTEGAPLTINGADTDIQQDVQVVQDTGTEVDQPMTQAQKDTPFVPWPTEAIIKQGALGHIQAMLEKGQDPATISSMQTDEAVKIAELNDADPGHTVMAASEGRPGMQRVERNQSQVEEKPKIFTGLDLYTEDMEDDL